MRQNQIKKNSRNKNKTDSYINLRFFTRKGIADDVDLPSEKTGTGRTLGLDLECGIVPVCVWPHVGNFERKNYKSICLVIS